MNDKELAEILERFMNVIDEHHAVDKMLSEKLALSFLIIEALAKKVNNMETMLYGNYFSTNDLQ